MLAIAAFLKWPEPGSAWLLAGCLLYLAGNTGITMLFNVPLNNALAAVAPDSAAATGVWSNYLSVWTAWNHVRTVSCLAATAAFIAALR